MTVRLRPSAWSQRLLGALMVIALGYVSLATSCAGGTYRYDATLGLASSPTARSQRVLANFFSDRAPDFWLVRTHPARPLRLVSPETARIREADESGGLLVADAAARRSDAGVSSPAPAESSTPHPGPWRIDCSPDRCATVLLEVDLAADSAVQLEITGEIDTGCGGDLPWFDLTLTPVATP